MSDQPGASPATPTVTRTLKFEVVFPGLRAADRNAFFDRIRKTMDGLTQAATRTASALFLLHQGMIPWPTNTHHGVTGQPYETPKQRAPLSLAYQAFSGKWEPFPGTPIYQPTSELHRAGSGVCVAISALVATRVSAKRQPLDGGKALAGWLLALQGREALSTFRALPLIYPARDVAIDTTSGRIALTTWAGRKNNRIIIAPRSLDGRKKAIWSRLIDGTYTKLGGSLAWDRRQKKWFFMLVWTGPIAEKIGAKTAAIHFGGYGAVYMSSDPSKDPVRLDMPRPMMRAYDRAAREKRERLQYNRLDVEKRVGRGIRRKLRLVQNTAAREGVGKLGRIAETATNDLAALVVETARRWGAGCLLVEVISDRTKTMLRKGAGGATKAAQAEERREWFARRTATLRAQIIAVAGRHGLTVIEVERPVGASLPADITKGLFAGKVASP